MGLGYPREYRRESKSYLDSSSCTYTFYWCIYIFCDEEDSAYQDQWLISLLDSGEKRVLYINFDNSLGEKDRDTRHLEPVDWFHDHTESSKTKPVFKNAFCYLEATLRIGTLFVNAPTAVPDPSIEDVPDPNADPVLP